MRSTTISQAANQATTPNNQEKKEASPEDIFMIQDEEKQKTVIGTIIAFSAPLPFTIFCLAIKYFTTAAILGGTSPVCGISFFAYRKFMESKNKQAQERSLFNLSTQLTSLEQGDAANNSSYQKL